MSSATNSNAGSLEKLRRLRFEDVPAAHKIRIFGVDYVRLELDDAMFSLTERVVGELASKGFQVIDNKPRHFILRPRPDGTLMRRDGKLVYALIDFELLKRLPEYEEWLTERREAEA